MSIDYFLHVLWASAMMGKTSHHVQVPFRAAFAALRIPKEIKTDNGLAYVSRSTWVFFHTWGITHKTSNSRACSLHIKGLIGKTEKGENTGDPAE